jgi:hypothetical protein
VPKATEAEAPSQAFIFQCFYPEFDHYIFKANRRTHASYTIIAAASSLHS